MLNNSLYSILINLYLKWLYNGYMVLNCIHFGIQLDILIMCILMTDKCLYDNLF